MSERPWYHAGLRFECIACGDCCTGAPGFVWVNKEEIELSAACIGLSIRRVRRRYVRKWASARALWSMPTATASSSTASSGAARSTPRGRANADVALLGVEPPQPGVVARDVPGVPWLRRGPLVPLEQIQQQMARRRV